MTSITTIKTTTLVPTPVPLGSLRCSIPLVVVVVVARTRNVPHSQMVGGDTCGGDHIVIRTTRVVCGPTGLIKVGRSACHLTPLPLSSPLSTIETETTTPSTITSSTVTSFDTSSASHCSLSHYNLVSFTSHSPLLSHHHTPTSTPDTIAKGDDTVYSRVGGSHVETRQSHFLEP